MRSKEMIMSDINNASYSSNEEKMQTELTRLQIEILTDIRDLLAKNSE